MPPIATDTICVGIDPTNAYLGFLQHIYVLLKGSSSCSELTKF
jgi:hypothetical protein